MGKLKFYLDTSVLGAVFDVEDPERVDVTKQFLKMLKEGRYIGHISNISVAEVENAPADIKDGLVDLVKGANFVILEEKKECVELVKAYLEEGIVPPKYRDDARHIAVAVVSDMDAIISWNYRHMVNFENKIKINSINLKLGYETIDLITPLEVIGSE